MIVRAHHHRVQLTFVIVLLVLLIAFAISVATGQASLSLTQLGRVMIGQGTSREHLLLFDFRLPRILVAMLAGMGLAISGSILQSVTRNPLADPGILGINAGAGLMVVVYVMFFSNESTSFLYILPLFALLGGILTGGLIYLFSYKKGEGINPTKLVLVGIGLAAAISGAILTLSTSLERQEYDFFASWMAGKIWGDDWVFVFSLLPWMLLFLPIVLRKANILNILNVHEHVSVGLGVHVTRERIILLFIAVALAAVCVSVSGGIAFVGLIAPHLARSLTGPRHQYFLPLAAMLGAILLLVADTIGRVLLDPSGIPAGLIVAVIGAPYFLYLMVKK